MNAILVDSAASANILMQRIDWKKHGVSKVFVADSMQRAQELFQKNAIDIMVSDIDISQGSGFELFEWVKSNSLDVECVYITGHAEFDYLRRALQLGSADYVLKPLDYRELDRTLSETARRVRCRHRLCIDSDQMVQSAQDGWAQASVVDSAKLYIREHIQEKIYIADIANTLSVSEWHLMRTFKSVTGASISRFVMMERLWLAKELLSGTNYPVKQVSNIVGYENHSYFIRMFKQSTGTTPRAYRLAHSIVAGDSKS